MQIGKIFGIQRLLDEYVPVAQGHYLMILWKSMKWFSSAADFFFLCHMSQILNTDDKPK
jgi:hypothetical protein